MLFPLLLTTATPPAQAQSETAVADLWRDVSLGPPLIEWFNRTAGPNDIARVENVGNLALLEQIRVGRKLVVFRSVDEAERLIPSMSDQLDIIGYNLEQGPNNPDNDKNAPIESAIRMRDLADEYDLKLAFGPDHYFALNGGVEIAPYVDIFVLQVQRVQTEHQTVREFVLPLIPQLREANPDLHIAIQLRTEGDVVELVNLVDSMKGYLNGVSILTSPETVPVAEALVEELQMRPFATPRPPKSSTATAETIAAEIETIEATAEITLQTVEPAQETARVTEPDPVVPEESTKPNTKNDVERARPTNNLILFVVGAFVAGIVAVFARASRRRYE